MMPKGRPQHRPQQVLVVIEAASAIGQSPTYSGIARAVGIDRTDVRRICRKMQWLDFSPMHSARKAV